MTWDRVIQDSDEEEGELEGDALSDVVPSIDPLDSQFEHKTEQRDVGGRQPSVLAVDINHDTDHDFDSEIPVQEVDVNATEHTHDLLGFGASQLGVNFDAYLQQSEEEGARVRLSSSQRRREERWIPTELGNGSICAIMTEIGIAQARLFHEEDSTNRPQQLHAAPTTMDLFRQATSIHSVENSMMVMPGRGRGSSDEGIGRTAPKASKNAAMEEIQGGHPDATIPQTVEGGLFKTSLRNDEQSGHTRADLHTSHERSTHKDSATSYNYFESSLKVSAESSMEGPLIPAAQAEERVRVTRSTPMRSRSMQQAVPYSPHDTEPISSLLSPGLSRVKSDNVGSHVQLEQSQKSTVDELSLSVAIELPKVERKRGRFKKQFAIVSDDDELANTHDPPTTVDQSSTRNGKRKRGRPPNNVQETSANAAHNDSKTTPAEPESDGNGHVRSVKLRNQFLDDAAVVAVFGEDVGAPAALTSKMIASNIKPSKKRKIKRGKTSSVVLKKSHESDVEDDVIWVDEKPTGVTPDAEFAKFERQIPDVHLLKPDVSVCTEAAPLSKEEVHPKKKIEIILPAKTSETADTIPSTTKKRGRKRKKTEEQVEELLPTSGENNHVEAQPTAVPDNTAILADITNTMQDHSHEDTGGVSDLPPVTPIKETHSETLSCASGTLLKGPDKHSPISSTSKVPYRVGLSRRARIAPLLKIVRK